MNLSRRLRGVRITCNIGRISPKYPKALQNQLNIGENIARRASSQMSEKNIGSYGPSLDVSRLTQDSIQMAPGTSFRRTAPRAPGPLPLEACCGHARVTGANSPRFRKIIFFIISSNGTRICFIINLRVAGYARKIFGRHACVGRALVFGASTRVLNV